VNPAILSRAECEALPVGSIVHSAWNKYREYAVKTPTHWLMLNLDKTVGLSTECGDGWVVDYVPTQVSDSTCTHHRAARRRWPLYEWLFR